MLRRIFDRLGSSDKTRLFIVLHHMRVGDLKFLSKGFDQMHEIVREDFERQFDPTP